MTNSSQLPSKNVSSLNSVNELNTEENDFIESESDLGTKDKDDFLGKNPEFNDAFGSISHKIYDVVE
jgi:hypothetical protein